MNNNLNEVFCGYKDAYLNLIKPDLSGLKSGGKESAVTKDFLDRYARFLYCVNYVKYKMNMGRTHTSSFFVQDLLAAYIRERFKDDGDIDVYVDYPIKYEDDNGNKKSIQPDILVLKKGEGTNRELVGLVEIKTTRGYSRDRWYLLFNEKRETVKKYCPFIMNRSQGWAWPSNFNKETFEITVDSRVKDNAVFSFILSAGNMMGIFKPLEFENRDLRDLFKEYKYLRNKYGGFKDDNIKSSDLLDYIIKNQSNSGIKPDDERLLDELNQKQKPSKGKRNRDKKQQIYRFLQQLVYEKKWDFFGSAFGKQRINDKTTKDEIKYHLSDKNIIFLFDEKEKDKIDGYNDINDFTTKWYNTKELLYKKCNNNSVEYLLEKLKANVDNYSSTIRI